MTDILERLETEGKIELRDGKVILKETRSLAGFVLGLSEEEDQALQAVTDRILKAIEDPEAQTITLILEKPESDPVSEGRRHD